MIPYTLAKEMKDNGFPQTGELGPWCITCDTLPELGCHEEHRIAYLKFPTLEEVIEALGKNFWALYNNGDGATDGHTWMAQDPENQWTQYGPTPLIAACNLWLQLNRK